MERPGPFLCGACGNRTRFDVTERRRTRSFFHFTLGGDLTVEEEELLEAEVERVACRWCGAADPVVEAKRREGAGG